MQKFQQINVLIVDDEPAAHARLEDLLDKEQGVKIVAQARSGAEALRVLKQRSIDLVFLDVQMPGMTGLDVVDAIGPAQMPMVIFVTAYDQFALDAFNQAALDYLLKPFDDERFEQAMKRARKALQVHDVDRLQQRLATLVGQIENKAKQAGPSYLKRIAVEMRGQIRIVPVEMIDYILASGQYAELHVAGERYVVNEQMQRLDERLDPAHFFRIHRSTIVQLNRIESLKIGAGGDYAASLVDGSQLKVSRRRWDNLVERLGL